MESKWISRSAAGKTTVSLYIEHTVAHQTRQLLLASDLEMLLFSCKVSWFSWIDIVLLI